MVVRYGNGKGRSEEGGHTAQRHASEELFSKPHISQSCTLNKKMEAENEYISSWAQKEMHVYNSNRTFDIT